MSRRSDIGSISALPKARGRVTFEKGRFSGSSFVIGGVAVAEHGGCLLDLPCGLLNSLFYSFKFGLEYSGSSVRRPLM